MIEVLKRYDVLVLRRHDLVGDDRRLPLLQLFDDVCVARGTEGDVHIELSPLAVLWLARDAQDVWGWLRGEGFCTVNLSWVDLSRADLTRADLRGAILRGAILREADLTGAILREADLTGADLRGADLTGAILREADLTGADLRGADLRVAILREADLTGAEFSGALRNEYDAPVKGWTLRYGRLQRST